LKYLLMGAFVVRFLTFCFAILLISTQFVLAAARSPDYPTGFDHPPTNREIKARLHEICVGVSADKARAPRRCACYVNGVMKHQSPAELNVLRTTGHFADSVKPKVKALMESCKVQIDQN
jgi:hypothetical protein